MQRSIDVATIEVPLPEQRGSCHSQESFTAKSGRQIGGGYRLGKAKRVALLSPGIAESSICLLGLGSHPMMVTILNV